MHHQKSCTLAQYKKHSSLISTVYLVSLSISKCPVNLQYDVTGLLGTCKTKSQ
jgi:hypothetical protein